MTFRISQSSHIITWIKNIPLNKWNPCLKELSLFFVNKFHNFFLNIELFQNIFFSARLGKNYTINLNNLIKGIFYEARMFCYKEKMFCILSVISVFTAK